MEEKTNEILDRIIKIKDYYGLKQNSFCSKVGITAPTLNSLVKRNTKPSFDTCERILNCFDDISAEWFMRGEGEMLKSKSVSVEQSNINNGSVGGDLNQSISNVSTDELAKIKLMLKGCSTIEEFQFVADIINKATNQ